ncbi:MAG: cyclic nucleotide-binding domain-containing protein [Chloroflexi bacterium]|nr:cyclic nucleotide-binding domain-containing protein [Chloroflexota bacterium]
MTLDRRLDALRTAFPDLDDELITRLALSARELRAAAGNCIVAEGEAGEAFYIILEGRIQISKFLELGTQRLLNELHRGQFFGEMALIEDAPRMASAYALEETTLLVIAKQDFRDLLAHSMPASLAVMRSVVTRFRDADRLAIDELREKNRELAKAYAELSETTRRKSEFLTVVSHELRTPLTSIRGYAQLMRTGVIKDGNLPGALDVIVNNTDALVRLINNILFLQELELIPPVLLPLDVREIVSGLVESIQPRAAETGLSFDVTLPPDLPFIAGDRDGLTQAIGALIDNAVKFSPNGGCIRVRVETQDRALTLSIADPGVGIPPDEVYHIFDRFHHLEADGDHMFGGVGLGLPIAKQVVEQHGGRISVVSRVGRGSTFTVTLPLSKTEGATERRRD